MRVLLTRPVDDANAMAAELTQFGIESVVAPVIEIHFANLGDIDLTHAQAVTLTSRNSLKSLEHSGLVSKLLGMRAYVVGPATASAAKQLGFADVTQGPGTASGLAQVVVDTCDPAQGRILDFAGRDQAFDLTAALQQSGFEVAKFEAYHAEAVPRLSHTAIEELEAGTVNAVILMSARTAELFGAHVEHHNLNAALHRLHFFCLSSSVKEALMATLNRVDTTRILTPKRPNREEFLALIARFAANSHAAS